MRQTQSLINLYIYNNSQLIMNYPQVLLLFYRKVVAKHQRRIFQLRKLHNLLEKVNQTSNAQTQNAAQSSKRQEVNQRVHKGVEKEVEHEVLKRGEEEWGCKWLFLSFSFEKNLLFAAINQIILAEDYLNFKCLEERLNERLEKGKLNESIVRAISFQWLKFGQILLNKSRLRWEKLLEQSVERMPAEFDDIFLHIFSNPEELQLDKDQIISRVSQMFKVKILYFQIEGRRILKNLKFGLAQSEIYLCYLHDIDKYAVCSRLPQQSEATRLKQQALNELQLGIGSLLQQYQQGGVKMNDLCHLNGVKTNQWKVSAYLSKK